MINIRNDKRHTCNWLWMFILVFAFMEMLIYRQATRLETASLSTNRGLRPSGECGFRDENDTIVKTLLLNILLTISLAFKMIQYEESNMQRR